MSSLQIFRGISSASDAVLDQINTWLSYGNPRVRNWPLMDVGHAILVVVAYLATIFLLQKFMKNREAYKLKTFATLHNVHLTLLSLYMLVETVRQALSNNYTLFGNPVDDTERGYGMARIIWIFYISKIVEFIDTIIMALKKNFHQITFLHLYHHASIFIVWWGITYFVPGGESYFTCALNSFIHVLMYSYYLWSANSAKLPEGKKPHPGHPTYYKQLITTMQMTQFVIMMIQSLYDSLFQTAFPTPAANLLFFYMISMLALFGNFFMKAYGGKKGDKKAKQNGANGHHTNGHSNGHTNGVAKKHD